MATKTRDPDYSAAKRNNISEINISPTHFSALGFVNVTLTFMSFRWLLSFIVIGMIVHRPFNYLSLGPNFVFTEESNRKKVLLILQKKRQLGNT